MKIAREYSTKTVIILSSIFLSLSIFFQAAAVKNILISVYSWHLSRPETTEGGIEIIIYGFLFFLCAVCVKNKTVFSSLIIFLCLLYLWAHFVLFPVVAVFFYFEIILSFGFWLRRLSGLSPTYSTRHYLDSFILGLSAWTCLAVLLSWFKLGTITDLRILTGIIAVISISSGVNKPLSVWIVQKLGASGKLAKIGFLSLLLVLLIQFAKTTRAFEHDSLWYGLRPEKVLVGPHSFFDHLGLVSSVFYYPKLYELFLLPISGFESYSFILCAGVFVLLLFCILVYSIGLFLGLNRLWAILLVLLIATLPVVANISSTAKSDILTNFLMLLAVFRFSQYFSGKQLFHCLTGFSCCLLSLGGKLYSLVYIPVFLFAVLIVFFLQSVIAGEKPTFIFNSPKKVLIYYGGLVFAAIATIGIILRTYTLTGAPFYPLFVKLWENLGFTLQYPLALGERGGGGWKSASDLLTVWYHYFFAPQTLPHIIMLWTGNVSLFLLFMSVLLAIFKKNQLPFRFKKSNLTCFAALSFLIVVTGILLISFKVFKSPGGDGNYFILPLILFVIYLFSWSITRLERAGTAYLKGSIFFSILFFIIIQSVIMFVSHPSWSWGTGIPHYSPYNAYYEDNNKNTEYRKQLQEHGLLRIEDYISKKETKRAIGVGKNLLTFRMPWSYESLFNLTMLQGNSKMIADRKSFLSFLRYAKIRYFLFPTYASEKRKKHEESGSLYHSHHFKAVREVFEELSLNENARMIHDTRYSLLDITHVNLDELLQPTILSY